MTKKRLLLVAFVPITIAIVVGVLAMLPHRPGVTKSNFDRIEEGMTRADVEEIFGRKGQPFHGYVRHEPLRTFVWSGDDGSIAFVEIVDNSITSKKWEPSTESITEKLRRWLHLPK